MPLDPEERVWILDAFKQFDTDANLAVASINELAHGLATARDKIKAAEDRNKAAWGLVITLSLALGAGAVAYIYWSGQVDANAQGSVETDRRS